MIVREVITNAKTGEVTERMVEMPCMTAKEAEAADIIRRGDQAREDRNARLAACDWTVLPDAPLTDAQRAAWTAYRTALRDVTDQTGFPDSIAWPTEPTDAARLIAAEA